MKLSPFNDAERAAVIGISGSGKSFAAKGAVRRELERCRRVVAFDPCDEWSRLGRRSKAVTLGPLNQRVTFEELEMDIRGHLCADNLSLAVVCSDDQKVAAEQCAQFVLWVKSCGNMLAVFEEVGFYAGPDAGIEDGKRALNLIATQGRHWADGDGEGSCPVLFVGQRMVHVPASARAQLTQLESFLQTMPQDLDELRDLTRSKAFGGCKNPPEKPCEFSPVCVAHQAARESMLWCSPLNKESKS